MVKAETVNRPTHRGYAVGNAGDGRRRCAVHHDPDLLPHRAAMRSRTNIPIARAAHINENGHTEGLAGS
jgi:hypothetical protein